MRLPESVLKYQHEIWQAIGETFVMVGISIAAAVLIGLPLGTLLYLFRRGQRYQNQTLSFVLGSVVNIVRSFPFLLLVVFMIPFTRIVVGTSIGTLAATVPLSVIAIAYYARLVEQALLDVPRGWLKLLLPWGHQRCNLW